jgi:nucleoid-associated protein YgaU
MADRRAKIVLASAVMVSVVGGSLMFLRPKAAQTPAAEVAAPPAGSSVSLRHRIDLPSAAPPGVSHLLGSIEPAASATAGFKAPRAVPLKTATSRQAFEVGELPAPSSALRAGLGEPPDAAQMPPGEWNPMRDRVQRPLVHHVREGDTLSALARRYLGSADRYGELFAANQQVLADPNHLRVGLELVIPQSPATVLGSPPELYRAASTVPSSAPAAMVPINAGAWRRSRQGEAPVRTYRVRADDTLVDIAKQFYGDGSKFQDLYEANRHQLSSPDQLHEGLLLVIP